jgi:S-adenosylmethionine synthetase
MASHLFSSESVTEGHPDKLCDAVSDSILDAILKDDPNARVACETFTKTGFVLVGGEVTTTTYVDIPTIVRSAVEEIGYTGSDMGFDAATCGVMVALEQQSPDIARGVDRGDLANQGAGDQGLMFGYACDETDALMPLPIQLAHQLAFRLTQVRKKKVSGVDFLRPDGKTQVSVRYDNDQPVGVEAIVVSTQHADLTGGKASDAAVKREHKRIEEAVRELVIKPIVPAKLISKDTKFHINPTGRFVVGGPMGDSGLTGRKIIVDTYGGMARHGGGAFSGKDPSKVDRSAAYYARYIAKHVVAACAPSGARSSSPTRSAWPRPVSMLVQTFGTGTVSDDILSAAVAQVFDARPGMLTQELDLRRPIFKKTAAYGHFGRSEPEFTWEKTPKLDALRDAVSGPAPKATKKK